MKPENAFKTSQSKSDLITVACVYFSHQIMPGQRWDRCWAVSSAYCYDVVSSQQVPLM